MFLRSIFGLICVYNLLPQYVVDCETVTKFQSELTFLAKSRCRNGCSDWHLIFNASYRNIKRRGGLADVEVNGSGENVDWNIFIAMVQQRLFINMWLFVATGCVRALIVVLCTHARLIARPRRC